MHNFHHRRSIRLPRFDYSQPGAYFVTICTKERKNIFGEIKDGEMALNPVGEMVQNSLSASMCLCNEIEIDEFVIMPDHLHIIIWIVGACATRPGLTDAKNRGAWHATRHDHAPCTGAWHDHAPCTGAWHAPLRRPRSLSSFVGLFKSKTTSLYRNMMNDNHIGLWQRNYYERIIRNDDELNGIRQYIRNNPSMRPYKK